MMPTDAMSWLVWVIVAGLLALLWASALLLARTVLPGCPPARRMRTRRSENSHCVSLEKRSRPSSSNNGDNWAWTTVGHDPLPPEGLHL